MKTMIKRLLFALCIVLITWGASKEVFASDYVLDAAIEIISPSTFPGIGPGDRVLVVTHAGTLDAIVRWAIGLAPNTNWECEFPFANCSLTEFVYWPKGRVPGKAPRYCEFTKIASIDHLASIAARES